MTPPPESTSAFGTPTDPPGASTVAQTGPPTAFVGPASDLPGYEIEGELGRGGMGIVYRAKQLGLNRIVALKMLPGGEYADPQELARFLGEAEVVAAVRHPHVVQVYDFGQHAARPYFAMEHLGGGSLVALIREAGKLAPARAAALVEKVARGVQAAHDQGIVHRDLKPANVLLTEDGEPKVTDFGLAKRGGRNDLTRTGAVMGTPHYMAPEQAAGKTKFVGAAADIYALGVILYECLTGRTPFTADDTVKLLLKVVEDQPAPIREFAPNVPRDLEAICLKCLRKEPHERYGTAGKLADDLRRFLNGEPVAARSTGMFGKMVGALDRSGKDIEFAGYANVLFGFALVTLVADSVQTAATLGHVSLWAGVAVQYVRLLLYAGIVGFARKGTLLPRTAAERQLWSITCGYAAACFGGSLALRFSLGWGADGRVEPVMYQLFATLAALTFFALGSVFWGWCYGFGVAFLGVALVMSAALPYAPLMFGLTWAVILTLFGLRLRRLARESADLARAA
ncbi:MAG: serine/threonine protein kinase [Planctomycetes bacterium]|nr:serine/threonine protein kinase [Planctomycetota bacterium]